MRLLTCDSHHRFNLTPNTPEDELPPYAILSHTWSADGDEVTFADLQQGPDQYREKAGYEKIRFCGEQAEKDGIGYFWVDTCCIDKANHSELSETITSMYRWYHEAKKCYVYLADVSAQGSHGGGVAEFEWALQLQTSRWFTRGWTLQELLAPTVVEFYSREGDFLGTKETLAQQVHKITNISLAALYGSPLSQFPIAERWQWARKRQTKKKEDRAYCLLGIFDVFMPLMYGEGDNALRRLEIEIINRSNRPPSAFTINVEDLADRSGTQVADLGVSHAAEDERRGSATNQQSRFRFEAHSEEGIDKVRHQRARSIPQTLSGTEVFVTFQDDLTKSTKFTYGNDQHRIFFLRRRGSDWTQSSCTEQSMSAGEIKDRIKHGSRNSRRQKQNIKWTLDRLESRRRSAVERLLQEVNRTDPRGQRWRVVAVDSENAKLTKQNGEVDLFSVILAKAPNDTDPT